jgi:hypothetical protein
VSPLADIATPPGGGGFVSTPSNGSDATPQKAPRAAAPWTAPAPLTSALPPAAQQARRQSSTNATTTHSQATTSTPPWTSPQLIGLDAASQLNDLAATVNPASAAPAARGSYQSHSSGASAPHAPSGPPCNAGGAAGGSAGSASSGAWAGLGVSPVVCLPSPELRPQRLSSALWRPMAFVSLQERPG